jgi:hypothetical protein
MSHADYCSSIFFIFFHSTFPASAGLDVSRRGGIRCSFLVSYSIRLAVSAATGWAEKKQKPRLGSGWTFVVEVSDGSGEVICAQAITSLEANHLVRIFYGSGGCGVMVIRMATGA